MSTIAILQTVAIGVLLFILVRDLVRIHRAGRMSPEEIEILEEEERIAFYEAVSHLTKKTARLELQEGDPGQVVKTKIGGVPWWPIDKARPICTECGNPTAFFVQVLLSDVPGEDFPPDTLISFHSCEECDSMAFGGRRLPNSAPRPDGLPPFGGNVYDVEVLSGCHDLKADGLGILIESPLPSCKIDFEIVEEICTFGDFAPEVEAPEDFPHGEDEFDENVYPGLRHVARSKVGGWPTWVQHPEWPLTPAGERSIFVCQLDWELGSAASWGDGGYLYLDGGYLYLFVTSREAGMDGEMIIQTT